MANSILNHEVVDVLRRSTISGNVLVLPPGQLDRKLYEAVNKALANAGGKWKRGVGHVFTSDPSEKLAAMLGTGVSVDEKKRDQSFFTPPELAKRVVALAKVRGYAVLEPSAGMGALATACMDAGASYVDCVETNPEYVKHLRRDRRGTVTEADFLSLDFAPYKRIVANPPFTRGLDLKHVNHMLKWLAPDGILVAIMMDSQRRKGFEELVAKYNPEIIEVERGAFKESGTMIPTIIVKIEQRA